MIQHVFGPRGPTRRRFGLALLLAAVAVAAVWGSATAVARAGPRPTISPLDFTVDEPLRPNAEVRLPPMTVTNVGDETGNFRISITSLSEQEEFSPSEDWFTASPPTFELKPGDQQQVVLLMIVPDEADEGPYSVLLLAEQVFDIDRAVSGSSIAIAVATTLHFSVEFAPVPLYRRPLDFFSDRAPFSYIGLALLVLLAAYYRFRERLRPAFGAALGFGSAGAGAPAGQPMMAGFGAPPASASGGLPPPRTLIAAALLLFAVWSGVTWWLITSIDTADQVVLETRADMLEEQVSGLQFEIRNVSRDIERLRESLGAATGEAEATATAEAGAGGAAEGAATPAAGAEATATAVPTVAPPTTLFGRAIVTNGLDLWSCKDFETQAQAQLVYEANQPGDPNFIDGDRNGVACESLLGR